MGYARTKLEEVNDRVKELESLLDIRNRFADEQQRRAVVAERENSELQKCAAMVQISLEQERDALQAKLEAAEKALDGRLGIGNPDSVRQACQEYVAAEDELPEWCDGEAYRLSTSVRAVVAKLDELQKENERLIAAWQDAATERDMSEAHREEVTKENEQLKQRLNHLSSEVREMATDLLEGNEGDKAIGRGWLELLKPTNYQEQPPCDNAHVAPGCEQFQSAEHEALHKENEQLKTGICSALEFLEMKLPYGIPKSIAILSALVKEGEKP